MTESLRLAFVSGWLLGAVILPSISSPIPYSEWRGETADSVEVDIAYPVNLVVEYFHSDDISWALAVMECESQGDPTAVNPYSGASGLFQHMPQYWDYRSSEAGFAGADILDTRANVGVAAWLYYEEGASHWSCKGGESEDEGDKIVVEMNAIGVRGNEDLR